MHLSELIHKKPYENTTISVRTHLITYVPTVIFFFVLFLVPAAIYFLISAIFPGLLTSPVGYPLIILSASVYCLSVLLFFYTSFVEFYLDLHIITNDRLVDIEQISLFARKIAEVDLYQIQDVSSEVKGALATIFNYGTVTIQTAGSVPKFFMNNVPNPHQLRRTILDLSTQDKKIHSH